MMWPKKCVEIRYEDTMVGGYSIRAIFLFVSPSRVEQCKGGGIDN